MSEDSTPDISPSVTRGFFKKNVEDGMDKVLEQVNFVEKFSSLPQFKPDECLSPSAVLLSTSPRLFVNNYKKKSTPTSQYVVVAQSPQQNSVIVSTASCTNSFFNQTKRSYTEEDVSDVDTTPYSTINSSSAPSTSLVGGTFFGPDFNVESFTDFNCKFVLQNHLKSLLIYRLRRSKLNRNAKIN